MNTELVIFILYLIFTVGIGVYFFLRSKDTNEKDYFLGGRKMGPWVSALSAGASDMSAWVLMGLPASVYAFGVGKTWIAIGLAIGYTLSWIFEAPRLRRYSIAAKDSITIPPVSDQPFPVRQQSHAGDLRRHFPGGVYGVCRQQHQGLRHAVSHRGGH